jgi:hypothetical protein
MEGSLSEPNSSVSTSGGGLRLALISVPEVRAK